MRDARSSGGIVPTLRRAPRGAPGHKPRHGATDRRDARERGSAAVDEQSADYAPPSQLAASLAWYVRMRSAPARRMDVRISSVMVRPSIQPRSAAAFTIAY